MTGDTIFALYLQKKLRPKKKRIEEMNDLQKKKTNSHYC